MFKQLAIVPLVLVLSIFCKTMGQVEKGLGIKHAYGKIFLQSGKKA